MENKGQNDKQTEKRENRFHYSVHMLLKITSKRKKCSDMKANQMNNSVKLNHLV